MNLPPFDIEELKSSYKKLSDDELIDAYLADQKSEQFSELYGRYSNKIYSKCLSMLQSEVLATDALQDIFVKVFMNLSRFNRKSKFSTWVYSITYNYCIDVIRKKKKENALFGKEENEGRVEPSEHVDDRELLELDLKRLTSLLDEIPPQDKAILAMKYKEGMSIREISEVFNKSESAIKMMIKRAKQKVRKLYAARYSSTLSITLLWVLIFAL